MNDTDDAPQPLAGVRVLDFSTLLPGPMTTLILAEAGAEVARPCGGTSNVHSANRACLREDNCAAGQAAKIARMADANPIDSLSDRETEVLALVAEGLPNTRIAERLSVSEHTVKFHLQNVFQKLNVANRTEAARVFLQWKRPPP